MFETPIPVPTDESGAIFIDRSPKHFDLILNFMRDGHVDLQKYSEDVKEIQKEAEYYLLEGLVELCIPPKPEIDNSLNSAEGSATARNKLTMGHRIIFALVCICLRLIPHPFFHFLFYLIGVIVFLGVFCSIISILSGSKSFLTV
ncbi:hypothetical protein B9Z55_007891 [Caenorhabditis nigoni]|nr:hypothetical protein B9Z55_007891 [Caenorhabditis nigoni]